MHLILSEHLQSLGLQHLEQQLLEHLRPAVLLHLGEPGAEVGQSHLGGLPDLPPGLDWPLNAAGEALNFLLQLNLSEVPPFEGNPLPRTGMLYFFMGLDEPATDVDHQLLLYTGPEPLVRTLAPDLPPANDAYLDLPMHRLVLSVAPDLPHWASDEHTALTEDLPDPGLYDQLLERLQARPGLEWVGQLLGHVSGIGQDPRMDAHVVRDVNPEWLYDVRKRATLDTSQARKWQNLLRLESVRPLDLWFWDAGFVNVLVHQQDLQQLNFDRLYVAIESS